MATRNIVPRATGEGGIGTAAKKWALGWINALIVVTINALTLTANTIGFSISGGTTSKTLTVKNTSLVNQDLTTDSGPSFDHLHISGSAGIINTALAPLPLVAGYSGSFAPNDVSMVFSTAFIGMAIITNNSFDKMAIFGVTGAPATVEISDPGSGFSHTKDTSNMVNFYWDTNGYYLQNKTASAASMAISALKVS